MKPFLKRLLLFCIPLVLFVVLVFAIPVNRHFAYGFVNKGGCEARSSWIHKMIFEDERPIDIAFIGTSHSMCAIKDEWIEKKINDSLGTNFTVRNLSYCGFERNLNYVMARDLLENKKVKLLVLEVREAESQSSHIYFGNIAKTGDLFTAPLAYNRYYLRDLYFGFIFRLQHIRENITGEKIKHQRDAYALAQTYGYNGGDKVADANVLYARGSTNTNPEFVKKGLDAIDMKYVEHICELAKKTNTKVIMVYLPMYASVDKEAETERRYAPYGRVIFPPADVLDDKANWQDEGHVNIRGSNFISPLVAAELVKELEQK